MYLTDYRTGEFHVIIDEGHGPQRVCGGLVYLCLKTLSEPPHAPLCVQCRERLKRREAVSETRFIRSRNMLSTIATVMPGNLLATLRSKAVKPLPGQKELF